MRERDAADRLEPALVILVDDRHLHVTADAELVDVAAGLGARVPGEVDRTPQPLRVGAHREADRVRRARGQLDRPRSRRGDVDRRLLDVQRRVDVHQPRHRRHAAVDLDVLAAEEALQPADVLLELRDGHRLLLQHLHGAVTAADAEARPSA